MPQPRLYRTHADQQSAYRLRKRLAAVAPHVVCRQISPACTVYCCDWREIVSLMPHTAAVITDPPYHVAYDVTTTRRRPSHWDRNFVGADQPFDPTPWLGFPEVVLFGANHYWDKLPRGGSWCRWDKLAGTTPADFAPCEWIWLSKDGPPQDFTHLWRGGMRAGEENYTRLPVKHHPAQKPVALMTWLLQQTKRPVVLDPFMGSGSTGVACVRLGRRFVGIELKPTFFEMACVRLTAEVEARRQGLLGGAGDVA